MPLIEGFCAGIQTAFDGSTLDWIERHVTLPHSARSVQFDRESAPWLNPIIEAISNDAIKQVCVRAPTGGAKTTLLEVITPYIIAQAPGPMLITGQTDETAKEWAETRLIPVLEKCAPVADLFPANRHDKRKTTIIFPHMPLLVGGANMSNLQEKSMRYCWGDEVWQWKRGMVGEMKKRHHDRWNRKTVLVTQGWDEGHDMDEEFHNGENLVYGFTCPDCGQWQKYLFDQIKYTETRTGEGDLDAGAIEQSVYYQCSGCERRFADTSAERRTLAAAASYQSEGNNHLSGHVSFTYPAYAVWWIPWAAMVIEWTKANDQKKNGNLEPLKQFVQKRKAEVWKRQNDAPVISLAASDYRKGEYADGQTWEGELYRFMTIDRQRDHFWVAVRAWKADGSSRLLWEGKVLTVETARQLQERLNVRDAMTFQDAQHFTGYVYDDCAKYGWTALHGSGYAGFEHHPRNGKVIRRFYSPVKQANAPSGGLINYIFWSNEGVKDELTKLRAAGKPRWEHPADVSQDWLYQINSEVKKDVVNKNDGQTSMRYVKFRANHLWDCEAMQVASAMMMGALSGDNPE